MRIQLTIAIIAAGLAAWASLSPAPTNSTELWNSFASNPDNHRYIPDNSYAGYRRGEVPLPTVPMVVNGATEFGFVADGVTDNTVAMREAIEAAYVRGGGAIVLPAGNFAFDNLIRLRRSGVVIRGAGKGLTNLQFKRSLTTQFGSNGVTSRWNWSGGMVWFAPDTHFFYSTGSSKVVFRNAAPAGYGSIGDGAGQNWEYFFAGSQLATVQGTYPRGTRTLTVSDASGLREGQMILMAYDVTPGRELFQEITQHASMQNPTSFGSWLSPGAGYPRWQWPVEIARINGNEITLAQPLRVSTQPVYNCRVYDIGRHVTECGLEDVTVDLSARPVDTLSHNAGQGWVGVYASKAYNCWVRGVEVKNGEGGMVIAGTKGVTFQDVHVTGSKMMHHPYANRCESADALMDGFTIDLTGPQMPGGHGINTEWLTSGNVWTRGLMKQGTFDTHSAIPFDFLRTDITLTNNAEVNPGGATQAGLYAGRRVAHWNIRVLPNTRPAAERAIFVNHPLQLTTSAIVGVGGDPAVPGDTVPVATNSPYHMPNVEKDVLVLDNNVVPSPANLYDAQVALRGDLQGWVSLAEPRLDLAVPVAGQVTLKAGVRAKAGRSIASVEFLANDAVVATALAAPWQSTWASALGKYAMQVRMTDSNGEVVLSSKTPLTVGMRRRVEESAPELLFNGVTAVVSNPFYSGGAAKRFTSNGSPSVVLQFRGTRARFMTGSTSGSITADYYLDDMGTPLASSGYIREGELDYYAWDSGSLPDGVHTLRIVRSGEAAPYDAVDLDETGTLSNYPPIPQISSASFSGTAPFTVNLGSTGTVDRDGSIASYSWDTNSDGTPDAAGATASRTFSAPGTYVVKLTVMDNAGATGFATKAITVTASAPTASFAATPTSGDKPLTVLFDATGSVVTAAGATITAYDWDFTSDNIYDASGVTTDFIYTTAGTFTAKLRVTDSNGTQATATRTITVLPNLAPVVQAGNPVSLLAESFPVVHTLQGSYTDDNKPAGATYAVAWSQVAGPVGGAAVFSNVEVLTPSVSFPTPGIYTLRLTVGDSDLTGFADVQVAVSSATNAAPTISGLNPVTIFNNGNTGPLAFTVGDAETPLSALQVQVSSSLPALFPAANLVLGGSEGSRTLTATPAAGKTGVATITLVVHDGSRLASTSFIITVNAAPVATSVSVSPNPANVALGGTLQFTATVRDQYGNPLTPTPSVTWSTTGGGTLSTGGLLTAATSPGGPYTVTANSGGISGTASVTVGNAGPAPGNATVVNWFGNYVSSNVAFNSTQALNDADLNGDGNAWDAYRRVPFSMSTPLSPTAAAYAGSQARFYGGVNARMFGTSSTTKASIPAFSDAFIMNHGGSTATSATPAPTDDAMGFRLQGSYDTAWNFLAAWNKDDFLASGASNPVSFGAGSLLQISIGDSGGNTSLRWDLIGAGRFVVRNGSQWFVSEASFASGTADKLLVFSASTDDGRWAPVDPAAATHMNLDLAAAAYGSQNFQDLTAVGFYLENDLAPSSSSSQARIWWYVDQFRVDAVVTAPPAGYASYAASTWPAGTSAAVSGANEDPDKDGVLNFMEYALGTSPLQSSPGGLGSSLTNSALGLVFTRNTEATDAVVEIQGSDDLTSWTNLARSQAGQPFVGLSPGVSVSESGSQTVKQVQFSENVSVNGPQRRYLRLKVALVP